MSRRQLGRRAGWLNGVRDKTWASRCKCKPQAIGGLQRAQWAEGGRVCSLLGSAIPGVGGHCLSGKEVG